MKLRSFLLAGLLLLVAGASTGCCCDLFCKIPACDPCAPAPCANPCDPCSPPPCAPPAAAPAAAPAK